MTISRIFRNCALALAMLLLFTGCQQGQGTRISMDFSLSEGETKGRVQEVNLYVRDGAEGIDLEGTIEAQGVATLAIRAAGSGETLFERRYGTADKQSSERVAIDLKGMEPGEYKLVLNGREARSAKLFLSSAQSFVKPVFPDPVRRPGS